MYKKYENHKEYKATKVPRSSAIEEQDTKERGFFSTLGSVGHIGHGGEAVFIGMVLCAAALYRCYESHNESKIIQHAAAKLAIYFKDPATWQGNDEEEKGNLIKNYINIESRLRDASLAADELGKLAYGSTSKVHTMDCCGDVLHVHPEWQKTLAEDYFADKEAYASVVRFMHIYCRSPDAECSRDEIKEIEKVIARHKRIHEKVKEHLVHKDLLQKMPAAQLRLLTCCALV